MKEKLIKIKQVFEYLETHEILAKTISHPEVVNCEESKMHYDRYGLKEKDYGLCKNIVLRDKKGKSFWLIIIDYQKQIDLEEIKETLGCSKRIGFATENDLKEYLDTEPGSVSLFSVLCDTSKKVKVIIDKDLFQKPTLAFHPSYSGLTSFIKSEDAIKFLRLTSTDYSVSKVPSIEPKQLMKKLS